MIYKFKEGSNVLEIELMNEENQNLFDHVVLSVKDNQSESNDWHNIAINKKDVFRLIGALHLLHKEMK